MLRATKLQYTNPSRSLSLGIISLVTISGGLLASTTVSADSVVDQVRVIVPTSCTIVGTGQTSHNAEIVNGLYQSNIGSTTIKAYCNDSDGFAIYATGYTGNTIGETNSNKLVGQNTNQTIVTGTSTSSRNPDVSNWAMKLSTVSSPTPTYPITIDNGFSSYSQVPNTYTKVAHRDSGTDVGTNAEGTTLTTTYAAYISKTQPADTYSGQVIYTLVHPVTETPLQPQIATSGCINYFPNGSNVVGTMGCQSISSSDTTKTLLASNFSRTGYGFAGWSNKYDYATNPNQAGIKFYGPQEDITFTAGQYTGTNDGLALYAVWVKSQGDLQDSSKVSSVCSGLITAPTDGTANLSSVSALTDQRDNNAYAIAKLADGKCWMIENLRLDNTAILTLANTNNPLNDGTNVTLKHNYTDTSTYSTLSATSSVAYNADTAPDGWCTSNSSACDDQSRLRTDNTANRTTNNPNTNSSAMYNYGNYYNWYSATAGRGTYSFNTNNNSTAGDLCPSGWRLPKGGRKANVSVSDFWILSRAVIGADPANFANDYFYYTGTPEGTDASKAMRSYPNNYLYSGYVNGGSLDYRGSSGSYWSSTAYSSDYAYYLYLSSSNVHPGTSYYNKYYGRTLRCIASS